MKKYISIFMLLTSLTSWGQLVNNNATIVSNGTLFYSAYDFTNNTGATFISNGEVHLKGDLTNDGTVSSTSGTVYFDSSTNATQNLNGASATAQFSNLSINNTASGALGLAVADGFNLEVTDGVDITAGKLRLMGESQLIQTHTGTSANTGTGYLLKDQQGALNAYRYNFWSSPVSNDGVTYYTVEEIIQDGSTPNIFNPNDIGLTIAVNGDDSVSPIEVSTRWFYKFINGNVNSYNEEGWERLFNNGTTTPSTAAQLTPGQGYIMKGVNATALLTDQQNYSFEGIPHDGDYSINLDADKGYLVGNPYPSAIDANQFITDNLSVMDGTLYFWQHWSTDTHEYTEYGGNYSSYNLSGGVNPSTNHAHFVNNSDPIPPLTAPERYIPVGQGFMIHSETTPGGLVTFSNNQRTFREEGNNSEFLRTDISEESIIQSRFWIDYTAPNLGYRQLLLAFTNGSATDAFDRGFDGKMLDPTANDIFFTMEDEDRDFAYAIQGVGTFNMDKQYPFVLSCGEAGVHEISLGTVENLDVPIYILDEFTQTTHDLTQSDFEIYLEPDVYLDRFKIVFQPASSLPTDDLILVSQVQLYYHEQNILLKNPKKVDIQSIRVFNTLGQLVLNTSNDAFTVQPESIIPFDYSQAVYFIIMDTEYGAMSQKIINY
jgi:hypothetical protein